MKPNIIVVMTDQQRADCSRREGFPLDTTPCLDRLSEQGCWFNRAYTAVPICGPSRVSMLTGRYPSAHHVRENRGLAYAAFDKDLVDVMKDNGYATALIGKNHSHLTGDRLDRKFDLGHDAGFGTAEPRTAEEEAFDSWLRQLNHAVSQEPTPFPIECQGPYRAVTEAQRFIEDIKAQNADKPFFMWLSFAEPHNPYQVPAPYFDMFPPETLPPLATDKSALAGKSFKWTFTRRLGEHYYPDYESLIPRMRSNYYGMLRLIDDQVARLIAFLDDRSLTENTILVFLSDHGDFTGEYGLMRKGPEMPEVLMRVPMFMTGPGIRASREPHPAFVSTVDIMPTLCEAVGTPLPPGVQGRSLWPLLTGQPYPAKEFESVYGEQGFGGLHYSDADDIDFGHCGIEGPVRPTFDELNTYSQSGSMRMVRKNDWKLVYDMQGSGQLYHLKDDPYELRNLFGSAEAREQQSELLAELLSWTIRMQDPLPYPKDKYRIKTDPRNYWTSHQV